MLIQCKICTTIFTATRGKRTCSPECRKIYRAKYKVTRYQRDKNVRERQIKASTKWAKENPDCVLIANQKWKEKNRNGGHVTGAFVKSELEKNFIVSKGHFSY